MQENKTKAKEPAVSIGSVNFSDSPDPFFEDKKNDFLVAVYDKDDSKAESIYHLIYKRAMEKTGTLGETDEKYLRQIQVAYKQLTPFFLAHCSSNMQDIYQRLQSLIRKNVRDQSLQPGVVEYSTWKTKVNLAPWQEDLVFTNAITFQMTSGCSNYCRRCNEWALPKIRSNFSKDAVKRIIGKLMRSGNTDLALYGASDPLDWEDSSADLREILSDLADEPQFSLLTKIPRGKEQLLLSLLKMDINLSVSLTHRNRSRIEALENRIKKKIPKQHASNDLLIPAGLDEDFISVKPSITDGYGTEITPEGAWIIIPTFTSALHPFGHKKLPITRTTAFFPAKRIGRQALLVDYFKPLEVVGKDKQSFYLSRLVDVQVESLLLDNGSDELTPPGMRSLKEYFTIFDDIPRRQRKKMTRSVMIRLKKEHLSHNRYKNLSPEKKQLYRKQIAAHLTFCKKNVVKESMLCALSFFLSAVVSFIKRQPVKTRIIGFLVKDETLMRQKKVNPLSMHNLAIQNLADQNSTDRKSAVSLFARPGADVWEIFRFYATSLVIGLHEKNVSEFISACPSAYDPSADRFVPFTH